MTSPLVSIVIPTFDRPTYLKETVRSALAQTYENIEVLVGENGSGDATRGWEPELLHDPRFTYRRNPRNLGMSGNFNALADAARGEFLVALGDDDRILPQFVSRLLEEVDEKVRLVFCNHFLIDSHGRRLDAATGEQTRRYRRDRLQPGVLPDAQIAAWQQSIAISATLMHTDDLRRLRFFEDLNTPDTEFFIRLAQEGGEFAFVEEYLAEYRVHLGNTSSTGLSSERLVEYLLPMKVTPAVEPYKAELLGPLMMNAVSRCLQQGDRERARRLLRSRYYPRRAPVDATHSPSGAAKRLAEATEHAIKLGLQHLCAHLPAPLGCPAYRVVRAAKDWAHF